MKDGRKWRKRREELKKTRMKNGEDGRMKER
jgi:hypothetical protein